MKHALAILVALVLLVLARPAAAHDVRAELAHLDLGETSVGVELQVPLTQLRSAEPSLFATTTGPITGFRADAARALFAAKLGAEDREQRRFATTILDVRVVRIDDGDALVVRARLDAPASARWFVLHDDVILDRLASHVVYAFVRHDARDAPAEPVLVGQLHWQGRALVVDRDAGSRTAVVRSAFGLGLRHIAEGTDHLLFLLVLLLPAPLVAVRGAWRTGGARRGVIAAARIATAFTVGHSLTLLLATVCHLTAGRSVELLVALSILVSAGHAARPLFPGREALVAGVFGLVHGLAFATALEGFGVDGTTLALSLLGFNLGVEAMQLLVIAVALPLLAFLCNAPSYAFVRVGGALASGIAALGWVAERLTGRTMPTSRWVEGLAHHAPWVVGALLVMIVIERIAEKWLPRRAS